ncbi:putative aminotransferase TAT2 [Tasmannia lanceolata]|uniref:putative aminotransferase TAT2 n=1 Tax=Tasmannia lanceolata TaxID=3420 RepID=UPI004063B809
MPPSILDQVTIYKNGSITNSSSDKPCKRRICNSLLVEDQKATIRGVVYDFLSKSRSEKSLISLGVGDASSFPAFQQGQDVSKAIIDSVSSEKFNGYAPSCGIPFSRRAVADYLSWGVEYAGIGEDDVFLTCGGTQAVQICLTVLSNSRDGCKPNILLPNPGFPLYESLSMLNGIETRFYDLVPDQNWELDLGQIKTLSDSHTVAIVIINPNNPSGAVYSRSHLHQIAETAGELNLLVIADEIYGHMVFGGNKFVPMAGFASIAPVITIGGLSKRWLVPGWRLGWLAICDPQGFLRQSQVKEAIQTLMNIVSGPASIIQAAVPGLLSGSNQDFHNNVLKLLESSADTCYEKIGQIKALSCYSKPQGGMFIMVEVKTSLLAGINDDMDFARELIKEESVLVLPGSVIGLKNWVRIFLGVPVDLMREAFDRINSFSERHLLTA